MSDDDLADAIYEAAFNPEVWGTVLDRIGRNLRSVGGCLLLVSGMEQIAVRNTELVRAAAQKVFDAPHPATLRRFGYLLANPPPGFIASSQFFPEGMNEADPFFREKKELGLIDEAFTVTMLPDGECALFEIARLAENGPFSPSDIAALDRLRPHLARASLVAGRLRLEHARATVFALQALGIPSAVLSRSGRVRASNPLLDGISDRLKPAAFGGIMIAHKGANELFQQAVAASLMTYDGVVRSIAVPAEENKPALVLHVLPLRRTAHDIFQGADILVAVTAIGKMEAVPSPTVLTALFDMAPAEARLAAALASGQILKDASMANGITVKTARSYLEQIFRKTGTRQQSELVALLKSAGALTPPDNA